VWTFIDMLAKHLSRTSDTDWERTGIPREIVTTNDRPGLMERDAAGRARPHGGRAVLRAILPDL
jgi:hypothetical protein